MATESSTLPIYGGRLYGLGNSVNLQPAREMFPMGECGALPDMTDWYTGGEKTICLDRWALKALRRNGLDFCTEGRITSEASAESCIHRRELAEGLELDITKFVIKVFASASFDDENASTPIGEIAENIKRLLSSRSESVADDAALPKFAPEEPDEYGWKSYTGKIRRAVRRFSEL
jgi:hypothetical protein